MPTTIERIRSRIADEQGFALVLALGVIVVLGITGTSVALYTTANYHDSGRSQAQQTALSLAEAGLNIAYSTLEQASNPSMSSALSSSPVPDVAMVGGSATYYGTYDTTAQEWTLVGIGKVPDPAVLGHTIVREVHGKAKVGTATVGDKNNAIWNYVYADSQTTCTTIGNSVDVNVPFYVHGNLCMANSAKVTSYALQVDGSVTMTSPQNEIGDPSAYLHEAHIGGGCSVDGVHYYTPCGSGERVYATTVDASPTPLTKPPVDLVGTANNAPLGPMHNCTTGSVPWGGFDNDTNHQNVSLGTINIAPAGQPYDCKALDANGNVIGELGWDGSRTLTIAGTIYLDANIAFGQQNTIVYKGRATIYASGTISIAQKSTLCGVADCGTDWNPSQNLLAWVAGAPCAASGAQTNSFSIANNSTFQGAIYAVCDYSEGQSTTVWGPIIAHQLYLQNSTVNFYVPIGTPLTGMPATYDQVATITPEPGSWS